MTERVASFTPLPVRWPHALGNLTPRISVVERPTFDENEWQKIFNMRRSEQATVLESPHWLKAEAECPLDRHGGSLLRKTAEEIRNAMLGFQIWRPKGWAGIIVNARDRENGTLGVESVSFPESYAHLEWVRLLGVNDQQPEDLGRFIEGTIAALGAESVPAKNPFQYLEIGLQTAVNHGKAGAFLWMVGLDALLAAQGADLFAARLCRLLGPDTYIFPADVTGRQPAYKVGELAADIYQLRNQIAHGDRIREKLLVKSEFWFQSPTPYNFGLGEWSYQRVLCEAALFALCAGLRRVILDGHLNLLQQPRAWKRWLDSSPNPTGDQSAPTTGLGE
jgi:hypothetical protein